jgi:hypothetical protein
MYVHVRHSWIVFMSIPMIILIHQRSYQQYGN